MMSTSKVSIAMATYNGETFIKAQLDSILAQSFSEYELIVCDDGSADKTVCILEEYASKDSRVKIIKNETNLGYARNFMKAVSLCSGDYIFLADQDDIWDKNKISKMMSVMQKTPSIKLLVCKDFDFQNGSELPEINDAQMRINTISSKKSLLHCAYRGLNMCLRKSFAEDVLKRFDISKPFPAHDWLLQIFATEEKGIYALNQILAFHRKHSNNTASSGEDTTSRYTKRISVLKKTIAHYEWALHETKDRKMLLLIEKINFYNSLRLKMSLKNSVFSRIPLFIAVMAFSMVFNLPKKCLVGDFLITNKSF